MGLEHIVAAGLIPEGRPREDVWAAVSGLMPQPARLWDVAQIEEGSVTILTFQVMVPGRESTADVTVSSDWPVGIWS